MMKKKLNLALLMGGPSSEHEVSLRSGAVVHGALDARKYNITPITVSRESVWHFPDGSAHETDRALARLKEQGTDVVFIAMHGEYGEDGTVQALLENAGLCYTGSDIEASRLAMDKRRSAEVMAASGVKVPRSRHITKADWERNRDAIVGEAAALGIPAVVKPANLGSSVGVTVAHAPETLPYALEKAFTHSGEALVQEYIAGDEVTCGILDEGGGQALFALPPTQIIPKVAEFFDYEAKYQEGGSEEITPARLPRAIIKKIQEVACAAHEGLGASGLSRTDMIVRGGEVYYLETNTLPGFTATSLYPQAAEVAGIPFPELLDRLIAAALRKKIG